jgi:hypothetical protein
VLATLHEARPEVEITLWTTVPRWFFAESLGFPFDYRELVCDVGLVQRNAVEEDLAATLDRLDEFWSESKGRGFQRRDLVEALARSGAAAVLCDISPLGLLLARDAGLPSILLENFTWDWIYEGLIDREPRFAPWVERLRGLFALAGLHLQAEPVCAPKAQAVVVPPIARRPRSTRAAVRERLGIAAERAMVLVSFGGVEGELAEPRSWTIPSGVELVVPGGAAQEERVGRLTLLPHHTPLYHPDLVVASDLVVGKLGYSTVAEAVAAGSRVAYLPRPGFREHAVLADFVHKHVPARELAREEFVSGAWLAGLTELLAAPRGASGAAGGAARAAEEIAEMLDAAT